MSFRSQRGVSIPAILAILAVVTILALTFLGVTRYQVQRTGFEQSTITAGYVAEIGFQQIRAELAAAGGEWSELNGIENNCATSNPTHLRCQRIPNSSNLSNFRVVRENPLDTSSRVIGVYEVAIETGQKRSIFGNRTLTGSTVGYVPGSTTTSERAGYDVYGNRLCDMDQPGQTCPGGFLGIRVTAWLTDSSGTVLPKSRSQAVYGVLQLDGRDADDQGPSGYLLESNANILLTSNTEWNALNGQFTNYGGFYGPIHTNERFEFEWASLVGSQYQSFPFGSNQGIGPNAADLRLEVAQRGNYRAARPSQPFQLANVDEMLTSRPFWGLLMAFRNGVSAGNSDYNDLCQPRLLSSPQIYDPSRDYTYFPYYRIIEVKWTGTAPQPAVGSSYTLVFRKGDGSLQNLNSTRSPWASDFITSSFDLPFETVEIIEVRQGGTVFSPTNVNVWNTALMDWRVESPPGSGNMVVASGSIKPNMSSHYCMTYITHSTISVQERMTYSGSTPVYRYWHEHPMGGFYPYQQGHGHSNILGADMTTNSTAVNADPGYHSTTWRHTHYISTDLSADPIVTGSGPVPNTYLKYTNPAYVPQNTARHEPPLLRPESGPANYSQQIEQLNKYLQLTLGTSLPRQPDGSLDSSGLGSAPYNASNYASGYLVGKFPASFPNTTPPTVDFRAVYFGNDLKYTAGGSSGSDVLASGSAIDATAWIWVDDNQASATYMKVANSQVNPNFKRYLYRQIPPSKLILARDAVVLIGNLKPQGDAPPAGPGNTCQLQGAHCLDFHTGFAADPPGQATIIDGQLSIVSFTTSPPAPNQSHYYNRGDIVIVGNVLYHNDFYALPSNKTQMRQLEPQPEVGYTRSNQVNPPITGISDTAVMWVTNDDGTRHRDANGLPVGRLSGLGLFATHDVKISVIGLSNGYEKDGWGCSGSGTRDNYVDQLTIHGQLVAGNKVRVSAMHEGTMIENLQAPDFTSNPLCSEPPYESSRDFLRIFGTVYSRESPDFSSYFRIRREYFYDRSLQKNPLIGAPYYPESAGDYRNQTIFSDFPKLVQGSWIQGAN
ncbi:MAG: hypothetical protein CVV27_04810 [Candidatus Melainabacteria bacterium HGW-Melainabacteria-1]|nr:MAG: hypothetical protein CVV27_04810 [Candidatus Melainabacteria bacterium HGW-Melainabacteria-1]